jgi:geranylgeranyl reductase family protein
MRADVVVVGAGPAGAATAILLAQQGIDAVLLDRAEFPRDKVCGEYLSPESARILDRLGVLQAVEARGARPLRGMRIHAPDGTTLIADYPRDGRWRGFRDQALAVRRRLLDALLVDRARTVGVRVLERMRAIDVRVEGGRLVGVVVEPVGGGHARNVLSARLVVAADGRASVVVQRLGLRRPHPWLRRLALVADVEGVRCDPERAEAFVAPPVYAIMNPVTATCVNLSLVVPAGEARRRRGQLARYFDTTLPELAGLGRCLEGARRVGPVRALGPLAYRVAPPRHGGVLLVGDAAGFLDPFTGEGVYRALRSAELAADAVGQELRGGDPSTRGGGHPRRTAEFRAKARVEILLQHLMRRPGPAVLAARLLARRPAHLARLMGVFGDFVPPRALLEPWFLVSLVTGRLAGSGA